MVAQSTGPELRLVVEPSPRVLALMLTGHVILVSRNIFLIGKMGIILGPTLRVVARTK